MVSPERLPISDLVQSPFLLKAAPLFVGSIERMGTTFGPFGSPWSVCTSLDGGQPCDCPLSGKWPQPLDDQWQDCHCCWHMGDFETKFIWACGQYHLQRNVHKLWRFHPTNTGIKSDQTSESCIQLTNGGVNRRKCELRISFHNIQILADSTGERGNATSGLQDPTKTRFFCTYTCSLKIVDSHNRRIMLRMANFLGPLAHFCEPFPNCWVISGALHWLTSLKPSEHWDRTLTTWSWVWWCSNRPSWDGFSRWISQGVISFQLGYSSVLPGFSDLKLMLYSWTLHPRHGRP